MNATIPFLNPRNHGLDPDTHHAAIRSVNQKHTLLVHDELVRLIDKQPRLTLDPNHWKTAGLEAVYLDRATHWNYYVSSGWGQQPDRPVTQWTGFVTVNAVTQRDSRTLIELRNIPIDLFYDGTMQAHLILDTIKAHIRAGLPGIDTTYAPDEADEDEDDLI